MHVSLHRRSQRIGLSMHYLLWICFGLLAVVPWQIIRGQESADPADDERQASQVLENSEQKAFEDEANNRPKRKKTKSLREKQNDIQPLTIFRSQTAPLTPVYVPPSPSDDSTPSSEATPASAETTTFGPLSPDAILSQPDPEPTPSRLSQMNSFFNDPRFTGRSGQAYGIQARMSAYTGPAIGRKTPLYPLEMMPYAFLNNTLFFNDTRVFTDMTNGWGGNFGGGVRQYLPNWDRIIGANVYFDYDATSGRTFREVGFGAESLGAWFDVRANAYLPVGVTSQQLALTNINGSQRFAGHFLLVDQSKLIGNALHGFDSEIGVPVPGRIARRHDLRVFGGGYWFEGTDISSFGGWKTRMQMNVIPSIQLQLQVSNDQQFKTLVVFGATWSFGGYRQEDGQRKTQFDRMTTPVYRQYNMVIGQTTETIKGVTVVNPANGNPYFFEQVASNATGPTFDGTEEHPFQTVAQAQAALPNPQPSNNDIIFVHGNSTYDNVSIALTPNVRVLGESSGVDHTVNTPSGTLLLPHPTPGVSAKPLFTDLPGNGVTLANNSEFSGFQLGTTTVGSGAAGDGIFGNGVSNVTLRQDDINSSGGDGVALINTAGTIKMQGDTINETGASASANAVLINGTTGNITFSSDPLRPTGLPTVGVINNSVGAALRIENTVLGSNVNFSGSTINDTAGLGVQVIGNAGQITLGSVTETNEVANGINILNDSGFITEQGTVSITGSAGDAINIQNLAAGGQVNFVPQGTTTTQLTISDRLARGINLQDNAGTVTILSPVVITSAGTVALPAIEYSGSSGNVNFQNITIGQSNTPGSGGGQGILIDPSARATDTGTFTVRGITNVFDSISDAITVENVNSIVTFIGAVNVTDRSRTGIEILDTRGNTSFNNTVTISNPTATITSPFPGIDIRATSANVSFTTANITGANGPAAPGFNGVGVNIGGTRAADANPGQVSFNVLNVVSNNGIGLFADQVGVTSVLPPTGGLIIKAGAITTTGDTAVDIEHAALNVTLTSVSSSNSTTTGITLIDNTPFSNFINATALTDYTFAVTGTTGGVGSGGTIVGAGTTGSGAQRAGVFVQNTSTLTNVYTPINSGSVSLSNMIIRNNQAGIVAENILHLNVFNSQINNNTTNGITGVNVAQVDIASTEFNTNGGGIFNSGVIIDSGNAINLSANSILPLISPTGGSYVWNIVNNNANNGFQGGIFMGLDSADAVVITNNGRLQDPVTGLVTPLVLNFINNNVVFLTGGPPSGSVINSQNAQLSALADNWVGPESGSINQNTVTLFGNQNAFLIFNSDLNFLTNFQMFSNTVSGTFGGNEGVNVDTLGPTDILIGNTLESNGTILPSTWTFTQVGTTAPPDTAMSFITGANSNINISNNTINMTGAGTADRGINFQFLEAPTLVTFSNNIMTVNDGVAGFGFAGQGINFVSTNGTINLTGAFNNIVTINGLSNQATTPWVNVSAGAVTTGTFIINGFAAP